MYSKNTKCRWYTPYTNTQRIQNITIFQIRQMTDLVGPFFFFWQLSIWKNMQIEPARIQNPLRWKSKQNNLIERSFFLFCKRLYIAQCTVRSTWEQTSEYKIWNIYEPPAHPAHVSYVPYFQYMFYLFIYSFQMHEYNHFIIIITDKQAERKHFHFTFIQW